MRSLPEINAANRALAVDDRVTQANKAKLADVYAKRLVQIYRISSRMMKRPMLMSSDDIEDLIKINDIAEKP
jgi:hypothetical protein